MNLSRRDLLASSAVIAGTTAVATAATSQDEAEARATGKPGKTPHTKFALNVEMWNMGMGFYDRIERAHELGFPAVEFWPWRGKDLDRIAEIVAETGIEIAQFTAWGFSPGMNNPANHAKFVEQVKASCGAAKKIGARKMTIVAGNNQKGMSQDEMLKAVTDGLKLAAPVCEDENVMMILEPMNGRRDHAGHCLYGSVDATRICREVDSPMCKINWDLYHMQIEEGDLCGRMKDGFDQIGYLQFADHPGRFQPGTGEIHYNRVFREAIALGYTDFVGAECRPRGDYVEAAWDIWRSDQW